MMERAAAMALDMNVASEPRVLDAPPAGLVLSSCPACTLLGAGCARDALASGHLDGNVCPVPRSAYLACEGCAQDVCAADCARRQETRMDRALLLANTLAAFGVTDLSSPLTQQIFKSVRVWEANNTLALLNGRMVEVDGVTVATVNKRSLPAFTGFWQLVLPQGGTGLRWAPCVQGLADAFSIPRFLRKFSAVALRGYTGAEASAMKDRGIGIGGGGGGGGSGDRADAEIRRLREQVGLLQTLNQQQEESVRALSEANERLAQMSSGLGQGSNGLIFQPMVQGSKYGLIDTRGAMVWGKCHLTLENVICCAGWCRDPVQSTHSLLPILCDGCEPGKNKEQKIRVCSFKATMTHVDVPRGAPLVQAWEGKFKEFRSTLAQFGSDAVLCNNFYTARQFALLYELLEHEAQRRLERAVDAMDKNDKRVPIRCSSIKIVAATDMIIKAALEKAFIWGHTFDPSDTRIPEVFEGFQSVAPSFSDPKQMQRPKRQAEGERVGDSSETSTTTTRRAERAKRAELRAQEVCFKYNSNEEPCGGKTTCPMGRKHVCLKCGAAHAKSLTPACQ
jgi:hypothetical protein